MDKKEALWKQHEQINRIELEAHREGCWALKIFEEDHTITLRWGHPWHEPHYQMLRRDRIGRRRSNTSSEWLVFRCTDMDCPARIGFLAEDIERLIGLRELKDEA